MTIFVLSLVIAACGQSHDSSIGVTIQKPKAGYLRLMEPVVVSFDRKVDPKDLRVTVDPATPFALDPQSKKVLVKPTERWKPGQIYSLVLNNVRSADSSSTLKTWKGSFRTQPRIGVAGFLVDGQPVVGAPSVRPDAKIAITFTAAMKPETVRPLRNGQPVPADQFTWAADNRSATYGGSLEPYQSYKLGIAGDAQTARGDAATDLEDFTVTALNVMPSNSSSGITADFKPQTPLLVVIDNAGQARPQHGLQPADMVYEYISEYGISRFTLVYFNHPANLVGPVRSCRMINAYLLSAFHGIQMCSGGSVGTLHYLFGDGGNLPLLATNINDFDRGNHYTRVGFKAAPHNLFTDSDRAERLRGEMRIGTSAQYAIDPGHGDNALGAPADAPSIGLHGVSYSYDGGCQCYRPFDHGSPRVDANLDGSQLAVKNVVIMHVPFHDAGWVEDENGGAHSIQYEMNGSGPAELWSNGKLVHATWHQGNAGQNFFQNNGQPMYLTDEAGNYIRLNTGLTWVHTVGNGQ